MRLRFVVREPAQETLGKSAEPSWRALYRVIADYEGQMRSVALKAIADTRRTFDVGRVAEAIGTRDITKIVAATGWEDVGEKLLWDKLPELLRDAMEDAGNTAARYLAREIVAAGKQSLTAVTEALAGKKPSLTDRAVKAKTLRFDIVNPRAVSWVREHAGQLIKSVTTDQVATVRVLLERSFVEGIPPRALALLVREHIGLTAANVDQLRRLERRLAGEGLTQAQIAAKIESETRRKIAIRAESISRTEIVRGCHEGQDLLWDQAASEELIERDKALEEWLVTDDDRLCPICEPLDGTTARLGGTFPGGYRSPPDPHSMCRCSKVLRPFGVKKAA